MCYLLIRLGRMGTLLFAYYTARLELLPAGMKSDTVFPHFIAIGLLVSRLMSSTNVAVA